MKKAIQAILKHPLTRKKRAEAVFRYIKWQISSRIFNGEQVQPWVNELRIHVKRGFHASTSCYYFGLPEFTSMAFLLHFLRPADLFVDVGANIGAYSLLAAGVSGSDVMAFEPEPSAAKILERNAILNQLRHLIKIHELGIGEKNQVAYLSSDKGIQNHILSHKEVSGIPTKLAPLDDFCQDKTPILIKIDVEGYETAVVGGASKTLANPTLNILIVERMGLGVKFGFDEDKLHQNLCQLGFQLFDYQPFTRTIHIIDSPMTGNNLYLRNLKLVESRVKISSPIMVHGQYI
ncbi:MAG: FkbM family methyltransferase [Bacteroidetes bacterium]|nr:FkbM family methyltransferase [Bacteroidota bacterium]